MLEPRSIAIIGASSTEGKVGHDILKNLLDQGYKGNIYPVNPKGDEILGTKSYASVTDIADEIDMAIIVIPAQFVPEVLQQCGDKEISTAVIISAGFSEVHTDEGKALEKEMIDIAHKENIQLIGPNCLGVLRPGIGMNASFAKELPPEGGIGLMSQSGAFVVAIMDESKDLGLGYSSVLSIGNKAVLNECDYLKELANDDKTKVIGMYLESIKDGQHFKKIAAEITKSKPIVLLKAGVSEHGKKAAASHTGALAGSDAAIDAVCLQAGIHRAHSLEEFTDLLRGLSTQPSLLSDKIAIITNAGGPGILATDQAEANGLTLPSLTEKIEETLKEQLPAAASTRNPIDAIGDADAGRYKAALEACGDDPNIDGICVLLTPQVMTPCDQIAKVITEWNESYPLIPITTSFMGGASVASAIAHLKENRIPNFETPERAIAALASLKPKKITQHTDALETSGMRATRAREILGNEKGLVSEEKAEELLKLYGLPLPKQKVAKTAEEATDFAEEIGFPVVAKISSPDIVHKTDVGGIQVNLKSTAEVEEAFNQIMTDVQSNTDGEIHGILIQQFLPVGEEFIIGSIKDPSFGPLIMTGLGGVYTELFKDTSFRIAPVVEQEAYEMLQQLKSWKLLLGMRGKEQSDIDELVKVIVTISQMAAECPEIQELDINPILVGAEEVVIADVKIVM